MNFNPDFKKQAQEVIFSRKIEKKLQPPLNFNSNSFQQVQFQKHLGVYLDGKLDFKLFNWTLNKTISLLHKLQNNVEMETLMETFYLTKPLIILFMKGLNQFDIMQHLQ